jgi:polysaccharide export outer membrane protein
MSGVLCWGQSTLIVPGKGSTIDNSMPGFSPPSSSVVTAVAASKNEIDSNPEPSNSIRNAGPLTTRSDFEKFAEQTVGSRLPVFGRQLFDEVPSTFAPMSRIPVPADYAIGPGDELLIRVWGKIDLDSRVTVDRNGQVYLPKIGVFTVSGIRYEQLEGYLRSAVGSLYKDFTLNATMGKLRSIQVYVLGNGRQPGTYTISALSTLVDALFASGGPSSTGTMRHIQLRRGNRTLTEFDIYDLLQKGDKSRDIQLLAGDVIYMPPVGPQAAVAGSVNRPGIYELLGDTRVVAALEVAGGLTSLAAVDRVLLERIKEHRVRQTEEFSLDPSGLNKDIRDGDVLRVFPISPKFDNAVILNGNVASPGRYVFRVGMRVSDLIPSRDSLLTRSYWNRQNLLVPGDNDHPFGTTPGESDANRPPKNSQVDRFIENESQNQRNSSVSGGAIEAKPRQSKSASESVSNISDEYENPDSVNNSVLGYSSQSDVLAAITGNNTEINWEYAVIERLDDHDMSTRLIAFHLGHAIDDPGSPDNQLLKAGDVLTVFSRRDIPLPVSEHATFVRVGGEVVAPGIYRVNSGETLRAVVERAGGLTPHSYLYASQLLRISTRQLQEEQLKHSVDQMQRDLIASNANRAAGPEGAPDPSNESSMREALLSRLAAVRPTGRVVLEMKPNGDTIGDIPAFPLEDGDTFYIPPRLGTIQVAGAVYNENAFRYQLHRPLSAYLDDSGGATREADVKRAFLIRADGTVVSRQSRDKHWGASFENLKLLPGDAIVVPARLKGPGGFRTFQEMTQILSQTALTAAALAVITK